MADVAQLSIKLDDNMISTFKKIESMIKNAGVKVQDFGKGFDKVAEKADVVKTQIQNIGDKGEGSFNKTNQAIEKSGFSLTGIVQKVAGLALAYASVTKAVGLLTNSMDKANKQRDVVQKFADEMARLKTNVNLSNKEFYDLAGNVSKSTKFSREQVMEIGVKSLRMKGVDKSKMEKTMKIAMGLSEREGISLEQSVEVVGKSISGKPTEALEAMRAAGVPVTKEMQRVMDTLEATGQYSRAGAKNMKFLADQYEGFAEVAAQRDPLFAFNKSIEKVQEYIGNFVITFKQKFAEIFNWVGEKIEKVSTWIKENSENIKTWAEIISISITSITIAMGLYWVWVNKISIAHKASAIATGAWATVQAILSGSMWTTVGAIVAANVATGGLILAIGAIVAGIILLIMNWEKSWNYIKFFAKISWEKLKEWAGDLKDIFVAVGKTLKSALTFKWGDIKGSWEEAFKKIEERAKKSAKNIKDAKIKFEVENLRIKKEKESKDSNTVKTPKNHVIDNITGFKPKGDKIDAATSGVGNTAMANISAAAPKVFVLNIQELNGINMKGGKITDKDVEAEVKRGITPMLVELTNALSEIQPASR